MSDDDRAYAADVADWCERELKIAKETGNLSTQPFVQNAQLIIDALREYAQGNRGAAASGPSFTEIKDSINKQQIASEAAKVATAHLRDNG